MSIYQNQFFHYFHLSESSFTFSGLRASRLAWRLVDGKLNIAFTMEYSLTSYKLLGYIHFKYLQTQSSIFSSTDQVRFYHCLVSVVRSSICPAFGVISTTCINRDHSRQAKLNLGHVRFQTLLLFTFNRYSLWFVEKCFVAFRSIN